MKKFQSLLVVIAISITLINCSKDEENQESPATSSTASPAGILDEIDQRNFKMGFSTWPYAATLGAQDSTYAFLAAEGDIYSEHIDDKIPWSAWMNSTALPNDFINNIQGRKNRKIAGNELFLSVSLLNIGRDNLAEDFNGQSPTYDSLNQQSIEDAYVAHLNYIINELQPDHMIISIEANELLVNSPQLWEPYKKLMTEVRRRIKSAHPSLPLSESMTLHNWFRHSTTDSAGFVAEIRNYVNNNLDFAAISFYPFFKGLESKTDYQEAFDFLHAQTTKKIAFSETTQIAEDLIVSGLSLNIPSNHTKHKEYLETLLLNAYRQDYEFVIWWAYKDYDALWQTFPANVKDLGQLWRDTGLLDENGTDRPALAVWRSIYNR